MDSKSVTNVDGSKRIPCVANAGNCFKAERQHDAAPAGVEDDVVILPFVKPPPQLIDISHEDESDRCKCRNLKSELFGTKLVPSLFGDERRPIPTTRPKNEPSMRSVVFKTTNFTGGNAKTEEDLPKIRVSTSIFETETEDVGAARLFSRATGGIQTAPTTTYSGFLPNATVAAPSHYFQPEETATFKLTPPELEILFGESVKPAGFVSELSNRFGVGIYLSKEDNEVCIQNGNQAGRDLVKRNILYWVGYQRSENGPMPYSYNVNKQNYKIKVEVNPQPQQHELVNPIPTYPTPLPMYQISRSALKNSFKYNPQFSGKGRKWRKRNRKTKRFGLGYRSKCQHPGSRLCHQCSTRY